MLVFFSIIIFIIILLVIILFLSTLKIKVQKLQTSNLKNSQLSSEKIYFDYEIRIGFYLFNKIKYLQVVLNKEKMKKYNIIKDVEEINWEKVKKNAMLLKSDLSKLKIELETFFMKLSIGTEDVLLTTGLIFLLSTFLSIGLSKLVKKYDMQKYSYEIKPLYGNENLFKLDLNCIINVKMVHIIHVTYVYLKKKRRSEVNYDRTSNRGTNDDSYEQYPRYGRCEHHYRGTN